MTQTRTSRPVHIPAEDFQTGDFQHLDYSSESDENGSNDFQDLVIKFSNISTLLEVGGGKIITANEGDIRHKISGKADGAVIVGVSTQDHLPEHSVGQSAENDARVISDICKIQLGMRPSRVKLLTSNTKKPTQKNIKSALKHMFCNSDSDSLLLVYFSGHGYIKTNNEHFLIPQDFVIEEPDRTGIAAKDLFKWLSKSKSRKILFLLDCCYAERVTEAMYRIKRMRGPDNFNKHLYLLASSEMSEPSISDETWLEHGYMTFLIKHYFNFVCNSSQQVSVRHLTHFIRKYTEPISRFTFTVHDGQVLQRPVLAHLGPEDMVETDAALPVDPDQVEYWRGRVKKTRAYCNWWRERMLDASQVLSQPTFAYSQLFYVIYLNSLHSISILLCKLDDIHVEIKAKSGGCEAFCEALQDLILQELEMVTDESYERYNRNENISNPRLIIQDGLKEGKTLAGKPLAPQFEEIIQSINEIQIM